MTVTGISVAGIGSSLQSFTATQAILTDPPSTPCGCEDEIKQYVKLIGVSSNHNKTFTEAAVNVISSRSTVDSSSGV